MHTFHDQPRHRDGRFAPSAKAPIHHSTATSVAQAAAVEYDEHELANLAGTMNAEDAQAELDQLRVLIEDPTTTNDERISAADRIAHLEATLAR